MENTTKIRRVNSGEILCCWGAHNFGQLGVGTLDDGVIPLPQELSTFKDHHIQDISCGNHHTVVILQDGTVFSTGEDKRNQHDSTNNETFQRIDSLDTQNIRKVVCGARHNIVINKFGQLLSWGDNSYGQLGKGFTDEPFIRAPRLLKQLESYTVIQVACGDNHTIILTDDGTIFTWGQNQHGQLGLGQDTPNADQPHKLKSLQGLTIRQIAAGGNSSFVLSISGAFYSWGNNNCGQLGMGDANNRHFPTLVKALRTQKIVYITCGEEHTMALTKEGRVFTFGNGKHGQLGHNSYSVEYLPRQVLELTGNTVTQIACGRRHSIAHIPSKGRLYAFGLNAYGQLGDGTTIKHNSPIVVKGPFVPDGSLSEKKSSKTKDNTPIPSGSSSHKDVPCVIKKIYCGGDHCFVIAADVKAQIVTDDFRHSNYLTQVTKFTTDTLRFLSSYPPSSILPEEVKSVVEKIFSSASCINGSFLLGNDEHYGCSHKNHGVNLEVAQEHLSQLSKLPNTKITAFVMQCLEESLLPNLPISPPDQEALRLYLTLPFLSSFDEPVNFNIIIQFAKSVVAFNSTPAAKVFDRWLETLLPESFERLISIYKGVVVYMMFLPGARSEAESMARQRGVICCMEFLKKLFQVNNENTKQHMIVNYDKFYIHVIAEKVDIRKDYVYWVLGHSQGEMLFCYYPFIFDAQAKTTLLHTDAAIQMKTAVDEAARRNILGYFTPLIDPVNPCLVLNIARDNIVQDTLNQLQTKASKDYKKPLKVIFIGEDAVDEGGVRKEFFLLLLEEILDPKYGMFKYYEESRLMWFNESTFDDPVLFTMIGVLCGLAIYNATIIDLHFPLALYKKLLKRPVLLEDLKDLQPSVGKSMESLLQYEEDDFEVTFCLHFEITTDVFGEAVTVPLVEGGSEKAVTKENRKEFVDMYIGHVFDKSVKQAFQAFYDGFHRVCGGKVLELFQPNELQEMVVGNQKYDWEELEMNTEYKGEYNVKHQIIIWFWEVFKELSEEEKRKYILFLTGSDRIPIHGMKAIKNIIQSTAGGDDFLPVAHTCFNLLDLPKYTKRERLKEKLLLAIQHCKGFALV